eukprot:1142877-Pelagomonas_calceolata.AAC.10
MTCVLEHSLCAHKALTYHAGAATELVEHECQAGKGTAGAACPLQARDRTQHKRDEDGAHQLDTGDSQLTMMQIVSLAGIPARAVNR